MNVVTLFGKIKVSFLKASSDTILLMGSGQIYYEKSPAGANRDTERSQLQFHTFAFVLHEHNLHSSPD